MARASRKEQRWSSRLLFVLAAAGSAVGLGNIWKFPYIAGENGGGAFVLVYLACVALVGFPILCAEVMLGRAGRKSPINAMRLLVDRTRSRSGAWTLIGWLGALAGFLILSYYAVIAGWALYYIWRLATGEFQGATPEQVTDAFNGFMADPWLMIAWQTAFMALTVWIVGRGVVSGLETAIRWFMPLLFGLLVLLLGYAVTSGGFDEGAAFLFDFRWENIGPESVLIALGQAFFTLSLGMGAMMAYGAYVPEDASVFRTVASVALLDTAIAIAAGLAIFPIVFANGLEADSGPGLMFITLPLAFGQMELGWLFGAVFFLLVSFAAITSAISLTEPALAYLVEEYNAQRRRTSISLGVFCWLLGIGTVLSFSSWSDWYVVGKLNFFDFVDYLSQNIMLPLGGLAIAVFAGWKLGREALREQLGLEPGALEWLWLVVIRVIAPAGVVVVFAMTIWTTLLQPMMGGD